MAARIVYSRRTSSAIQSGVSSPRRVAPCASSSAASASRACSSQASTSVGTPSTASSRRGLNRLPPAEQAREPHGTLKDYEVGFVHVDGKALPKLRDRDGTTRKRFL